jgi:hypothetical protein
MAKDKDSLIPPQPEPMFDGDPLVKVPKIPASVTPVRWSAGELARLHEARSRSFGFNPKQEAELLRQSQETGAAVEVLRNADQMPVTETGIDPVDLEQTAPKTTAYLADDKYGQSTSVISQRDKDKLAAIENFLVGYAENAMASKQPEKPGLISGAGSLITRQFQTLPSFGLTLLEGSNYVNSLIDDATGHSIDWFHNQVQADWDYLASRREAINTNIALANSEAAEAGIPETAIYVNNLLAGVEESLGIMLLTSGAGSVAAPAASLRGLTQAEKLRNLAPTLGGFTLTSGGGAYNRGREAGLEGTELAAYAISYGLAEAIPEAIGAKLGKSGVETFIANGGLKSAGGGVGDAIRQLLIHGTEEVPQEWATGIAQAVADKIAGVDKDALTAESIYEMARDATFSSYLLSGMVQSPAIIQAARRGKAQDAVRDARAIKQVSAMLEDTETYETSPEASELYMQTVMDDDSNIHVPADKLLDMAQNPEIADQLEKLGVDLAQVPVAAASGSDIEISAPTLIAKADQSLRDSIIEIGRVDPLGMSKERLGALIPWA